MLTMPIRHLFLSCLQPKDRERLVERVKYTEVGTGDRITKLDRRVAKKRNLKPLNRFERWVSEPVIQVEKKRRLKQLEEAMQDIAARNCLGTNH